MVPTETSLERNERNMEQQRGKIGKVGKTKIAKSQVEYHFLRFLKSRNYSRGIGDALHPSKIKVSGCQNHQIRPETEKIKTLKGRIIPIESSLGGNERNMEQKREK